LDTAEFDRFADEYLLTHARNVRISGEAPEYFARSKIEVIGRLWSADGRLAPGRILDFGAGIGNSLPHLKDRFPAAELIALDVSERSLEIARGRFGDIARFVPYAGEGPMASDGSVDLAFSACVFHHIAADEHVGLLQRLRRTLSPGGALVIFEHNPINPVTQHIVATCPFDENAVLLPARVLEARLRTAGFARVEIAYTGFFPHALAPLRRLEPFMGWLPLGAQYYAFAHG
jgi:SAM-dependent methyltransferase